MGEHTKKDTINLILYFIIAIAFSTICWIPGILKTRGLSYPGYLNFFSYLTTFGPLIAALILTSMNEGKKGIKILLKKAWNWKFNALISSLILGVFWAIWNIPLHFINTTVQYHIPIYEFSAVTIVVAILYTWIYNGTGGSLSAVILFHWMGNLFGGPLFVYYNTTLGRWIFFFLQLILILVIIKNYGYKKLGKEKVKV